MDKKMTADNWLFILVMGIIILTAYRKEMEEEWWG